MNDDENRALRIVSRIKRLEGTQARLTAAYMIIESLSMNDPDDPNMRLISEVIRCIIDEYEDEC